MTRRGIGAAIAVVAVAALLAGCTAAQPRVVADSVVRVAVDNSLTTLNAIDATGSGSTDAAVAWLTHGRFYTYDAEWQPVPDESFGTATPLPSDGFDVQYSLAESATWSDGVPVSSADLMLAWVAASGALDSLVGPGDRFSGPRTLPVGEPALFPAVGDDGRSLTVYFGAEPSGWQTMDPQVPAHVLGEIALGVHDPAEASAAVIDAVLNKDADALAALAVAWNTALDATALPLDQALLVSSGPYRVAAWTDSLVTLVVNPDYRGSRQPRVETIELVTVEEPLDAVSALETGDVDVITPTPSSEVQAELLSLTDATVLSGNDTAIEHLDLQIVGGRSGVFADERVREAFLLTLPRQQVVTQLLGELYEDAAPQSSFLVPQTSTQYGQIVSENGSDAYSEPDPDAAAALLLEAQVTSPEVCVLYDAGNESRVEEFGLIAAAAAEAGFVVTDCSTEDVAATLGRAGAYDAALFSWSVLDPSAAWIADVYSSTGSTNLTGYASDEVDKLIAALAVTTEPAERADILADIDAELWADAYGAPLFQHAGLTAFGPGVTGVTKSPVPSGIFWNATDWLPNDAE